MKQEIADYLSEKIRWLLDKAGVPGHIAESIDTSILFILVIALTFAIAEIAYRLADFALQRLLRRKHYLFLEIGRAHV